MKYLKKYESFEFHDIAYIGYFALSQLFIKYGSKYLLYKRNKKVFDEKMKDQFYSYYNWKMEEKGDLITVIRISKTNADNEPTFELNRKTREVKYIPKGFTVKLNKSDFDNLLNSILYTKEVSDTIEDCFIDLQDEGFKVELRSTDFRNKSFIVSVFNPGKYAGHGKEFKIGNIKRQLYEFVIRVEGSYNCKIDTNYKPSRMYEHDLIIISVDPLEFVRYGRNWSDEPIEDSRINNTNQSIETKYDYKTIELIIPFKK